MHNETLAAARLLAQALLDHPEDMEEIQIYGRMGEHLEDMLSDHATEDK